MAEREVLRSVERYLAAVEADGTPIRFGVLFGSQATGRAHAGSDIDLLVVSPRFDAPQTRPAAGRLWVTAARTDPRIEPIPCGERQWAEDDLSIIIEIARREGQIIYPDRSATATG